MKKSFKRFTAIILTIVFMVQAVPLSAFAMQNNHTHGESVDIILDFDNIEYVTREEYLQNYADINSITYLEAEIIDMQENAAIWQDYCSRNNIPQPRALTYTSSYPQAGATIWYVIAKNTYTDGLIEVSYGAQGKVVVDAHSRTFAINSFSSGGFAGVSGNNGSLQSGYSLYIDNSSYNRLYISLVGNTETTYTYGFSANAEFFGYTLQYDGYYRRSLNTNFTENL